MRFQSCAKATWASLSHCVLDLCCLLYAEKRGQPLSPLRPAFHGKVRAIQPLNEYTC